MRDPDLDFYGFILPTKRRRVKRAEQRRRVRARSRALRNGLLCDDEHLDFYGFTVMPDPDLAFYGTPLYTDEAWHISHKAWNALMHALHGNTPRGTGRGRGIRLGSRISYK